MQHIVYQGRKYKRVVMNIHGDAPFHKILKQVNGLTFPEDICDDEHLRYAVLELLNNSLRAHREKGVKDSIRLEIGLDEDNLEVIITDHGGGFDLKALPYDIDKPIGSIDTNNGSFQEYREKNQYKRFGMGLIVARRLFPRFAVGFFDAENRDVPWNPEVVVGTKMTMSIGWKNG